MGEAERDAVGVGGQATVLQLVVPDLIAPSSASQGVPPFDAGVVIL